MSIFSILLRALGLRSNFSDPRKLSQKFYALFMEDRSFFSAISLRMTDKHGISESQHQILFREYARYMALKASSPNNFEVPCKIVDEVWHEHLQFNRNYEIICKKAFGRTIYHNPAMPGEDNSKYKNIYNQTLSRYMNYFGTPPKEFWGEIQLSADESAKECVPNRAAAIRSKRRERAKASTARTSSATSSSDDGAATIGLVALGAPSPPCDSPNITPPCDTASHNTPASNCGGQASDSSSSASTCGSGSSSSCGSGCGGGCGGG